MEIDGMRRSPAFYIKVDQTKTRRRIEDRIRKLPDGTIGTARKLAELADALQVEIAILPDLPNGKGPKNERPCFGPNQVRCRHQLRKGRSYFNVRSDGSPIDRFTLSREPYQERGSLWIRARLENGLEIATLLAGQSIESFQDGTWENAFYTIFAGKAEPCRHPECQHSCSNCG